MQKTIVKYVSGISESASSYQKKQHKKYGGNIGYVRRNILSESFEPDLSHTSILYYYNIIDHKNI
jgi:hypothetical protein